MSVGISLSSDIKNTLESLKRQGEDLLRRLEQARGNQSPLTDISQDLISKGAGLIARDFFKSSFADRTVRKYTKSSLKQQQREQKRVLEKSFESEFNGWFTSLRSFVSAISIKTKNIYRPNSERLVSKLDKQLGYVRVEAKIRRILIFINQLLSQELIHNKEIPSKPQGKRLEKLLEPSSPFSSQQIIREILANAQGYVKVLDPWVDDHTLDTLLNVPKNIPIMLLTENIGGDGRAKSFIRSCKSFKVEKPQFQIRKCDKGLLHDRYIITRDKAYSIGSSLKDLGKKLSSINEIIDTKAEVEKQFDKIWAALSKLI